jgi:PhzF family phenazine biosynthesis protein
MEILRYAAFTADPNGGNPAGVVLEAPILSDLAMLNTAAEIGFSETAFVTPVSSESFRARYFSPLIEVPFCGHATIALAVAYAERHGPGTMRLETKAGVVSVRTEKNADGSMVATLISVPPRSAELATEDLAELLADLRWAASDLDPALPSRVAYAGAWHPVIAASSRARLADLDYDMAALGDLMQRKDWATIDLVWRESPTVFHARNPFPPGGIVEDPATGAAAAAFGGYLRELALIPVPATITIHQGHDMGRPGVISVSIPAGTGTGVSVTGTAVAI